MSAINLPPEFAAHVASLEDAYLAHDDPIRQSGFSGGSERWRAERGPLVEAIDGDGAFLDIGCANGYLLESVVEWARDRGHRIEPHGVDIGARLIAIAKTHLPAYAGNLHVGNAIDWSPPRRYRYVYMVWDCVPESLFAECCRRLLREAVEPGGKFITGCYGSRSRNIPPRDPAALFQAAGLRVAGTSAGGEPAVTRFAWVRN